MMNENTMNEALREKILERRIRKLRKKLKDGDARFTYRKKDGSVRNAHGTLKTSLIPKIDRTDERATKRSPDLVYYYDIGKEGWRCFIRKNLMKVK